MADELEPVTQRFEADLTDYVEPIQAAADDTQELADVVDELQGSLDGLSGTMDDAAASAEGLAEGEKSFRDAVYDANPGIDDQTASLLADAAAAEAAGVALDEYAASERVAGRDASGLFATLNELKDILGAAELGDAITIGKSGLNQYAISADDAAASTRALKDAETETRRAIIETDEDYMAARTAMDAYKDSIDGLRMAVVGMYEGVDLAEQEANASGGGGGILSGIVKLFGGAEGAGAMAGALGSFSAGALVIAPLIAAIVSGLVMLVSGFSAALIGVGSFAAFAIPALKQVYDVFTGTTAKSALHGTALEMYDDIESVIREYKKLATALSPDIMKVFTDALQAADPLLQAMGTFAGAASGPLDQVAKAFDKLVHSKGFTQTVQQLVPYIQDSIPAIAAGVGQVAGAIGNLMTVFSAPTVAKGITGFFGMIRDLVNGLTFMIGGGTIRSIDILGIHLHNLHIHLQGWAQTWNEFSGAMAEAGKNISRWWKDFGTDAANAAQDVDNFTHQADTDMGNWETDVHKWIDRAAGDVQAWAEDFARWIYTDPHSAIEQAISDVGRWASDVNSYLTQVVAWFRALDGHIVSALGDVGSLLLNAGRDIIGGLLDGIEGKAGGVLSYVENLGHEISSVFGRAIAALSPSMVFHEHGVNIVDGLIQGLESRKPALLAAIGSLAGGAISAGSAGTLNVRVTGTGTLGGGNVAAALAADPQYLQQVQQVTQEAQLRYTHLNQGTGVFLPGRRS